MPNVTTRSEILTQLCQARKKLQDVKNNAALLREEHLMERAKAEEDAGNQTAANFLKQIKKTELSRATYRKIGQYFKKKQMTSLMSISEKCNGNPNHVIHITEKTQMEKNCRPQYKTFRSIPKNSTNTGAPPNNNRFWHKRGI